MKAQIIIFLHLLNLGAFTSASRNFTSQTTQNKFCYNETAPQIRQIKCHSDFNTEIPFVHIHTNLEKNFFLQLVEFYNQNIKVLPGNLFSERLRVVFQDDSVGLCIHTLRVTNELVQIHENAFEGEPSCLKQLDLSYNKLTEIPTLALRKLKTLSELNLMYNNFTILRSNSFQDISNLHILNIRSSNIHVIETLAFAGLDKLTQLDLGENYFTTIAPNTFKPLASLMTLSLYNVFLNDLSNDTFKGLPLSVSIELTYKLKFKINEEKSQEISDNQVPTTGKCISMFFYNILLFHWESRNFSNGFLPEAENNDKHGAPDQLYCTGFTEIPQIIIDPQINDQKRPDISSVFTKTLIEKIPRNLFGQYLLQVDSKDNSKTVPACLKNLHIQNAKNGKIEEGTFEGEPGCITLLGLANNNFNNMNFLSELKKLKNLKELDLNFNNFETLKEKSFESLNSLVSLSLQQCNIKVIEPLAFYGLEKLETLNLGANDFVQISPTTFSGMLELKYLELELMPNLHLDKKSFLGLPNITNIYVTDFYKITVKNELRFNIPHNMDYLIEINNATGFYKAVGINNPLELSYAGVLNFPIHIPAFGEFPDKTAKREQLVTLETIYFAHLENSVTGQSKTITLFPESEVPQVGKFLPLNGIKAKSHVWVSKSVNQFHQKKRKFVPRNIKLEKVVVEKGFKNVTIDESGLYYETNKMFDFMFMI